ncbi:MAG: acyltransferase family protein, partial [Thermoanaerobaculia bacterium]
PLLGHLWFLYYLVLFYCAALALAALAARLGAGAVRRIDSAVRSVATRWWGGLLLGAVTTMTLVPMEVPGIETAPSLLPPARVLLAYFVFFGTGWLLFRHRDVVSSLGARWRLPLALGVAVSSSYLLVTVAQSGFTDARTWHLTAVALAGPAIWLLVFGIVGLFVHYMETPRPLVRYFADASYWMYLTHLVPAAWIPGVLADLAAPALVKFGIVFGSTTFSTVVTYHFLVRSTAIGALLSGRRYPRALPVPSPARSADVT